MYGSVLRHDVQLLLRAGVCQSRIREVLGVSERSIRRIGKEPAVKDIDDEAARNERAVGRPSKAAGFEGIVREWLTENPALRSVEVFHRMKQTGYTGGRSAAYAFIAPLREKAAQFIMRFEGLPGEFTQHDFGEVVVEYTSGR